LTRIKHSQAKLKNHPTNIFEVPKSPNVKTFIDSM